MGSRGFDFLIGHIWSLFLEDLRSYFFFLFHLVWSPKDFRKKKFSEVFNYSYTHSWFVFLHWKVSLDSSSNVVVEVVFQLLDSCLSVIKVHFLGQVLTSISTPHLYTVWFKNMPQVLCSIIQIGSLQISYQSFKKSYVH